MVVLAPRQEKGATAARGGVGQSPREKTGRTFDCRVVLVDEVALDELDGQTRFTDTTTADHHQLVLSQELEGQAR